jgi:putative intracellular protease/amidase
MDIFEAKKVVAAVCHAPWLLIGIAKPPAPLSSWHHHGKIEEALRGL